MGRVNKLLGGKDNVVRAAELVTVHSSLPNIHIKRPVQKLYPLEVDTSEEDIPTPSVGTTQSARDMSVQMARDEDIPIVMTAP